MVKIRLRRTGAKKQPSYRVVVADQRSPRDGRFIEIIGHYNPRTEPETVNIQEDRVLHWLSEGAQMTDTIERLFKNLGTLDRFARYKEGAELDTLLTEAEASAEKYAEEAKARAEAIAEEKEAKKQAEAEAAAKAAAEAEAAAEKEAKAAAKAEAKAAAEAAAAEEAEKEVAEAAEESADAEEPADAEESAEAEEDSSEEA
jgi:small subunit ribosomal protein S16